MGFIDSYKHLEKLCGEVLNDDGRITAYIDQMNKTPYGVFYVKTWSEDLKNLKYYRHIRNKISHEPGFTEENMCKPEDALWIDSFYSRIMNQTDPLALYHKALNSYNKPTSKQENEQRNSKKQTIETNYIDSQSQNIFYPTTPKKKTKHTPSQKLLKLASTLIILYIIVAVLFLLYAIYINLPSM